MQKALVEDLMRLQRQELIALLEVVLAEYTPYPTRAIAKVIYRTKFVEGELNPTYEPQCLAEMRRQVEDQLALLR